MLTDDVLPLGTIFRSYENRTWLTKIRKSHCSKGASRERVRGALLSPVVKKICESRHRPEQETSFVLSRHYPSCDSVLFDCAPSSIPFPPGVVTLVCHKFRAQFNTSCRIDNCVTARYLHAFRELKLQLAGIYIYLNLTVSESPGRNQGSLDHQQGRWLEPGNSELIATNYKLWRC